MWQDSENRMYQQAEAHRGPHHRGEGFPQHRGEGFPQHRGEGFPQGGHNPKGDWRLPVHEDGAYDQGMPVEKNYPKPTKLNITVMEAKGVGCHKTYIKLMYAGQHSRTATVKTEGDVATFMQPQNFDMDCGILNIYLMEDKFGPDAELAEGMCSIESTKPYKFEGWVNLESRSDKAKQAAVRIAYTSE